MAALGNNDSWPLKQEGTFSGRKFQALLDNIRLVAKTVQYSGHFCTTP